jgi:hypothetical protein
VRDIDKPDPWVMPRAQESPAAPPAEHWVPRPTNPLLERETSTGNLRTREDYYGPQG